MTFRGVKVVEPSILCTMLKLNHNQKQNEIVIINSVCGLRESLSLQDTFYRLKSSDLTNYTFVFISLTADIFHINNNCSCLVLWFPNFRRTSTRRTFF